MNTFDSDDPKLTAYALGELDGDEAAAIERQLAQDASLSAAVNEIRQTAKILSAEFASEPRAGLTDEQRLMIEQRPARVLNHPWIFRTRTLWMGAGLAAAACLAVVLVWPFLFNGGDLSTQMAVNKEMQRIFRGKDESALEEQHNRNETLARKTDAFLGVEVAPASDALVKESRDDETTVAVSGEIADAPGENVLDLMKIVGGYGPAPMDRTAGTGVGQGGAVSASESESYRRAERQQAGRTLIAPAKPPPPPPSPSSAMRLRQNVTAQTPGDPALQRGAAVGVVDERDRQDLRERIGLVQAKLGPDVVVLDNPFFSPVENPLSTFSIDVDTASYSNVRQYLNNGQLPPANEVRIEEMVNYFDYSYEPPSGERPFSAAVEVNAAPWNREHRLVRIGLKGKEIKLDMRPATSLVFLLDVSGSMNQQEKLPLVKESMKLLVEKLNADDRLAIVTYAGSAGKALDSLFCNDQNKQTIVQTIDGLTAGGSTNGAGGIQMAYEVASEHFIKGGVNRVVLCTDGDFNVGISGDDELTKFIEEKRNSGVFLSVLGFGTGNFQDAKMEKLADHGNGMFAYIDRIEEGKKVLVDQMGGTLITIAKDVKVQVEFNPAKVGAYRLIGYEDRVLAAQDFNDDRKDAGEIGAGHTVTALYEIVPPGVMVDAAAPPSIDDLKYQKPLAKEEVAAAGMEIVPNDELLTVKLRYKAADGEKSERLEFPVTDGGATMEKASADFQFASAVASFGMILRNSQHKGDATLASVLDLAAAGVRPENDKEGRRTEFIQLIERARAIAGQ